MEKKRIVVTGIGLTSCFGTDPDVFYDKLLAGESGITPIHQFPCEEYPTRFAGSVEDFDISNYMDRKQARRVDPFIRYVVFSGKKALESANLVGGAFDKLDKSKCGIIIGSGMGGMSVFFDGADTILNKSYKRLTPFFVPYIITNMGGALLAIDLGFKGPNYSISTACATSNYCIVSAAEQIRNGNADLMLCGGSEAPINPVGLSGFVAIKALSERNDDFKKASRPWDKARDGFVIGEGCGVLVLESLEHAKARGATILGEYLGGHVNCDAHHMTDPKADGEGVASCIEMALKDAKVKESEVNYINAHATSTIAGDMCELKAIEKIFKDPKKIKINGTKSMIGHCLGAAGGLEAIATLKAIERKKLHPTINLNNPEDGLENFDIVKESAVEHDIKVALSNSFGFGGHNSTIVLAPFKE